MLVLYIFSTLKIARVLVYTRTCRLAHTAHAYDSNPIFFSLTQNSGFFCIPWVSGYHDEGMFVWSSLCTFKNHDFWSTCTHVHSRKLLMIINVTYIHARCSTPSHACYWPALSGTVVCIGAVCSFLTYFQTCVCWRHACVCTCMYVVGISAHTFVMMMQVCRPLFLLLHFVCTCLILNFVCMWSQRIVHAAEHEVYWPSVCCFTGLQMCLRTPSSTRWGVHVSCITSTWWICSWFLLSAAGVFLFTCPHRIGSSLHFIPVAEGRNDAFTALLTRFPDGLEPSAVVFDFCCQLGEWDIPPWCDAFSY